MTLTQPNLVRLLPFAALLLLGGCNSQADGNTPAVLQPRPVLTALVEPAGQHQTAYTGVVAARTESDLGFRVGGKVIERRVDPGDRVARGDTLLVLDIDDFDLALRAATNRVRAAQAQLRQARDDEQRYRRLARSGAVSRQIFDQSATRLRVAEAELAAASSEASQVENRRRYSTLKADGDGIITDVRVQRGQVVAEGQVVARLAHDGAREAVIDIPENQRGQANSPAQALPYGATEQVVGATLRELSAAADPMTRTYRARYRLEGNAERFAIGSTITVRLLSPLQNSLLRVPLGALHDPGTGPGVWLIGDDHRVRFAPVQVARLEQEYALLQGGVSSGQRIVALGAHLLHSGDPVRLLPGPPLALANQPQQEH
ncbi:RND family efflux transporter MFP subunit [Pseudomonas sp. SJZ079]|uniref:efflux RND transporter periplasmic adaptor subunit n=1 Tax=Pseudomonas sp. SJZ079 TaxID=2572887 RepID=UPI00119A5FE7|nr:efflux RND transporter periplasmic adaptor subunit [Pseudomonas sp. SJZ079]TWC38516.1 RND family efflux transporter MFP subunit [Pseudomonas sp. SJZ079]